MMEEDIDIYGDLIVNDNKNLEVVEEVVEYVEEILEKNEEPCKRCEEYQHDNANLRTRILGMAKSLAYILKTARTELTRKNNMITELRKELDNAAFRRGKYQRYQNYQTQKQQPPLPKYPPEPPLLPEPSQPELPPELPQHQQIPYEVAEYMCHSHSQKSDHQNFQPLPSVEEENVSDTEEKYNPDKVHNTLYGERLRKRLKIIEQEERKIQKELEDKSQLTCVETKKENSDSQNKENFRSSSDDSRKTTSISAEEYAARFLPLALKNPIKKEDEKRANSHDNDVPHDPRKSRNTGSRDRKKRDSSQRRSRSKGRKKSSPARSQDKYNSRKYSPDENYSRNPYHSSRDNNYSHNRKFGNQRESRNRFRNNDQNRHGSNDRRNWKNNCDGDWKNRDQSRGYRNRNTKSKSPMSRRNNRRDNGYGKNFNNRKRRHEFEDTRMFDSKRTKTENERRFGDDLVSERKIVEDDPHELMNVSSEVWSDDDVDKCDDKVVSSSKEETVYSNEKIDQDIKEYVNKKLKKDDEAENKDEMLVKVLKERLMTAESEDSLEMIEQQLKELNKNNCEEDKIQVANGKEEKAITENELKTFLESPFDIPEENTKKDNGKVQKDDKETERKLRSQSRESSLNKELVVDESKKITESKKESESKVKVAKNQQENENLKQEDQRLKENGKSAVDDAKITCLKEKKNPKLSQQNSDSAVLHKEIDTSELKSSDAKIQPSLSEKTASLVNEFEKIKETVTTGDSISITCKTNDIGSYKIPKLKRPDKEKPNSNRPNDEEKLKKPENPKSNSKSEQWNEISENNIAQEKDMKTKDEKNLKEKELSQQKNKDNKETLKKENKNEENPTVETIKKEVDSNTNLNVNSKPVPEKSRPLVIKADPKILKEAKKEEKIVENSVDIQPESVKSEIKVKNKLNDKSSKAKSKTEIEIKTKAELKQKEEVSPTKIKAELKVKEQNSPTKTKAKLKQKEETSPIKIKAELKLKEENNSIKTKAELKQKEESNLTKTKAELKQKDETPKSEIIQSPNKTSERIPVKQKRVISPIRAPTIEANNILYTILSKTRTNLNKEENQKKFSDTDIKKFSDKDESSQDSMSSEKLEPPADGASQSNFRRRKSKIVVSVGKLNPKKEIKLKKEKVQTLIDRNTEGKKMSEEEVPDWKVNPPSEEVARGKKKEPTRKEIAVKKTAKLDVKSRITFKRKRPKQLSDSSSCVTVVSNDEPIS